jgi:hypothetical protein
LSQPGYEEALEPNTAANERQSRTMVTFVDEEKKLSKKHVLTEQAGAAVDTPP